MAEIVLSSEQDIEVDSWEEETERDSSCATVEKFLSPMFLRVLLVEADDSTRQIITALLRKCSYRVTAVSDGLKAWETLRDRPHDIDLILTEVELPSISGFALLTLVMEHEICKNIPVIMISSHDSISVAFKCMLRGAADFLIKPVRRNELRNLWQHVWRRQASTGGGNGPQDGSIAQRKVEATSENNAASNDSTAYEASAKKIKECSEKGSDAQSSCTKPDMEAESACIQNMQDLLQQKCSSESLVHASKERGHEECVKMNQKFLVHKTGAGEKMTQGGGVAPGSHREDANITSVSHENNPDPVESSREAIDLIGALDSHLNYPCGYNSLNDATNKLGSLLELSLKRTRLSLSENPGSDEGRILNHSNASAFSWYNNRTLQPLCSTSASFCAEPKECANNSQKHLSSPIPSSVVAASQWHGPSPKTAESMTSVVINQSQQSESAFPCPKLGVIPVPVPVQGIRFDSLYASQGAVLPPIFYTQPCPPPVCNLNSGSHQEPSFQVNSSEQSNIETQNSEQVYHPFDQSGNNSSSQIRNEQEHNLESSEDWRHVSPATAQSANSSFCNGEASHLNSSGCGSVCNGNNSNVTPAAAESVKDEGLFIHDGFKGMDSHRLTQREAALNKFRLKRKGRCFDKKVRYQSRKKLAEQRPRVKGQFVRQAQMDSSCVES